MDIIDNKVAFGMVFSEAAMGKLVHGVPLQPGHVRVSVDGIIKEDAWVPVPIIGEIETVRQAVGSHLAWPQDLIIFTPTIEVYIFSHLGFRYISSPIGVKGIKKRLHIQSKITI